MTSIWRALRRVGIKHRIVPSGHLFGAPICGRCRLPYGMQWWRH